MEKANQMQNRITAVLRWINGVPIYIFPYCLVGKKGMVNAFHKGAFINVNYKDVLRNCDKVCVSAEQWLSDKTMMDRQLDGLGVKTRVVSKASMKLGVTETLPA